MDFFHMMHDTVKFLQVPWACGSQTAHPSHGQTYQSRRGWTGCQIFLEGFTCDLMVVVVEEDMQKPNKFLQLRTPEQRWGHKLCAC